jgi:hypothetical protein
MAFSAERRRYIKYLRKRGLSYSQIGIILGISKQRVQVILAAKSKAKRYINISPSPQTISDLFINISRAPTKENTVDRNRLSRREAARVLNVAPATLTRWVIQGKLKCLLDDRGNYIYSWSDIESFLGNPLDG